MFEQIGKRCNSRWEKDYGFKPPLATYFISKDADFHVVLLTKILDQGTEVVFAVTQLKKKERLRLLFQEYNDCALFETWRYKNQ